MRFSDTDWLDEISRTGFSQNYDLSVSHANDKHSAMFSLGYKNNERIAVRLHKIKMSCHTPGQMV